MKFLLLKLGAKLSKETSQEVVPLFNVTVQLNVLLLAGFPQHHETSARPLEPLVAFAPVHGATVVQAPLQVLELLRDNSSQLTHIVYKTSGINRNYYI